jgi:hypothetical protein
MVKIGTSNLKKGTSKNRGKQGQKKSKPKQKNSETNTLRDMVSMQKDLLNRSIPIEHNRWIKYLATNFVSGWENKIRKDGKGKVAEEVAQSREIIDFLTKCGVKLDGE